MIMTASYTGIPVYATYGILTLQDLPSIVIYSKHHVTPRSNKHD